MSNSRNTNALVPSGQSNLAFAQQGSLDWMALGQMQYSASIAILGRLAKAGIDTLTVAFGQAMCVRLPIGAHGEKVLAQAMSTLRVKSGAGDLIWFGVGVRHILRELVQTSQGCSLVALCAALTEGHSVPVSALVLYEIAKQCGGPEEIAPSLEQWEALVRVAASVFNATTFGVRIYQIAVFSMHSAGRQWPQNSHPSDLAKTLLSIGQIVHGNLQSMSVQGGCSCSWIVAYADFVLGLRVLVRDANGDVVYANYNVKDSSAQVNINFLGDAADDSIICVESSHLVRSGMEFVRQCFSRQRLFSSDSPDLHFSCGRLQWETMFSDTFGNSFKSLLEEERKQETSTLPSLHSQLMKETELLPPRTLFVRIVAISAIIITSQGVTAMHHGDVSGYLLRACETIPELHQCKEELLMTARNLKGREGAQSLLFDSFPKLDKLTSQYRENNFRLRSLCTCWLHRDEFVRLKFQQQSNDYCLVALTDTVVFMTFLFDRLVLDTPLRPTAYGLRLLLDQSLHSKGVMYEPQASEMFLKLTRATQEGCSTRFESLAVLFSSEIWNSALHGYLAQSDGKIYCYIQLIEELSDSIEKTSLVHVGSGTIEYRTRHYRTLEDGSSISESQPQYAARRADVVDNIGHLRQDTSSNPIEAQPLVEERPSALCFQYQMTSGSGNIFVAPSTLLENMKAALAYKVLDKVPEVETDSWLPVLHNNNYISVCGEGLFDQIVDCHVLRPLKDNILGRCVAISNTKRFGAFVKTKADLEMFARFWAKYRDECMEIQVAPRYYALIS